MPTATLRLEAWSDARRTEFRVDFDPANITAIGNDAGCVLQFSLSLTPEGLIATEPALLAVHGALAIADPNPTTGGVDVPMQSLHPNNRILRIPLTYADLARIESRRGFAKVNCQLRLSGLANVYFTPPPQPPYQGDRQALVTTAVHANAHAPFTIEREHWIEILDKAHFSSVRLLELPTLNGPAAQEWAACSALLERATTQLRSGESEPAIETCRHVLEGVVTVLAKHWNIERPKGPGMTRWLNELADSMATIWPDDEDAAKALTGLYGVLWSWTSDSHHYRSKVPLHQEARFSVGLTAELLAHAGYLLAAHREPPRVTPIVTAQPSNGQE
jgi:hypothetical protein